MNTAVVLLNYNSLAYLQQFLPPLVTNSKEATIYIIDNASTDDSKAYVNSHFPSIRWIALDKNYGYAGGYAKGLQEINEELLILMNTDVQVTEGYLEPLLAAFQDENVGACMPKILDYNQRNKFEYAGAAGGEMDMLGYTFCRGRIFDTIEEDQNQYDNGLSDCFWASGACLAVRKDAYFNALGFDPRLFAHMEEVDLCWRMQRIGYRVVVTTNSMVYHMGGGTLDYQNPKKVYLNFRNNLIVCAKNWTWKEILYKLPFRLLLDQIAWARELIKGNPRYAWQIIKANIHFILHAYAWRKHYNHCQFQPIKTIKSYSIIWKYFIQKKKTYLSYENNNNRS